jgi:predicted ATP-dependent endonuclease of OLD family
MSFSSTGSRLVMFTLALMANDVFETLLIDEPELGLTPSLQQKLSDLIFNVDKRNEIFPHLKNVYIATHSHLFLDRTDIENNFTVNKSSDEINFRKYQL